MSAGRPDSSPAAGTDVAVNRRIARLAWLLDESVTLPGGFRIGLDGIVGLIPGLGDLLGLAASSYILYLAGQSGASKVVLLRMSVNILLETVVGAVPLIGDLFDFFFKANIRNLNLLQRYAAAPTRVRRVSAIWLLALLVLTIAVITGGVVLVVLLIRWLVDAAA